MRTSLENPNRDSKDGGSVNRLTKHMQGKLAITGLVIMLALFALIYKLYRIQKVNSDSYNQKVLSQQRYDSREIPYKRGDITDRNGTYLATSTKVYNLILDPSQINSDQEDYLEPTVQILSEVFGYDKTELTSLIQDKSDSQYIRYAKQLSHDQKVQFENRKTEVNNKYKENSDPHRVYGVWFEDAYQRSYPYNSLACNVLGFSLSDGAEGSGGIEQYYNDQLIGTSGREYGYLNDESNLERVIKPAEDGDTVVSTIDMNIQNIVEKHIQEFETSMGSKVTACIVMNPNNGEVLAMATSHPYNLNDPRNMDAYYTPEELSVMTDQQKSDAWNSVWRNFCVSDTYEPGSTSKIFTVSAGKETGSISGNESYTCNGSLDVGGWTIHCSNRSGHGTLDVEQGLMYSCNVVMMHIAQATGKENFCNYQRLFGFGSKTGIDLPGEADTSTLIHSPDNMTASDLATNAFGQNFNCSMIQLASAFSSVINGGSYYQPHVVKQVLNSKGSVVRDIQPELVRETVSSGTSAFIRDALLKTVTEGTGKNAQVEGYEIAGKTGTAEKYPRGTGNYLVSFCGYAPAADPQVLCYVVVDTPNTEDQAHSTYASSIFQKIMTDILPYMGIYPSGAATESDAAAAESLPAQEGISDSTTQNPTGETQAPVIYDVQDEVIETGQEGDALNLPGMPAGGSAAESGAGTSTAVPLSISQDALNADEHPQSGYSTKSQTKAATQAATKASTKAETKAATKAETVQETSASKASKAETEHEVTKPSGTTAENTIPAAPMGQ